MIKVYVSRFNRETDTEPHLECYEIEKTPQMKVLDALQAINEKYDADISFRSSCRAGQCGSCGILFKGNGALACQKEIKDGAIIEPLNFPIIKDLIVDKSSIEAKVKDLELSLQCNHRNELDTSLAKDDIADTKKVRSCIECYSCLSTCPVVNIATEEFGGPYLMRYINKFETDPRENFDRLKEALDEGLYNCTSCGKCLAVCPKNINTFGDAIEKMRAIACANDLGPLPEHVAFKENIEKTGRSIKANGTPLIEEVDNYNNSKVAFFTGCMVDHKLQDVGHNLIKVLKANGIDIDIPEGQVCCGSPLLRTGQTELVQELVDKNKEVFKDYDFIESEQLLRDNEVIKNKLTNDRKVISPKELDVWLPDIRLAIEYNGDYWHANPNRFKPTDIVHGEKAENIWYNDKEKLRLCEQNNIHCIVVTETEWKTERQKIINKIQNYINILLGEMQHD